MPAAAAIIPAAIGAGTSIFGAVKGASASQNAAAQQAAAAKQAQDYIQGLLDKYNPQIGTAAQSAADLSTQAGAGAVSQLQDTLAQNRSDVLGGVGQANQLLNPYAALGTQAASSLAGMFQPGGALAPGGALNQDLSSHQFNFQDIQNLDPGYQFRLDQASKALQSSAAARGGGLSGGTLSALSNLNQNMASAEAQNAFGRLMQQQQFRSQEQQNLFGRTMGVLNPMLAAGQGASGQQAANILGGNQFLAGQALTGGQNIGQWMIQPAQFAGTALAGGAEAQAQNAMQAGRSIADLITGAGNARAAGTMGAANAWSTGLGGVANAAGGLGKYFMDQGLLKQLGSIYGNPAVPPGAAD